MQTARLGTRLAAAIGLLLASVLAFTGAAGAQTDNPYLSDTGQTQGVLGNGGEIITVASPSAPAVDTDSQVLGSRVTRSAGLPVTGGEAVALATFGVGLVVVGGAAVVASRRRHAAV